MTILAEEGAIRTDSELARRIAALSPEQRRLLELRRKKQLDDETDRPRPLPRREGTNEFPLSFAQERLWFLDRLEPGSAAYNIPFHLRLAGDLDVGALRSVLDEIVRRHEALRTTFVEGGSGPVQVAAPALALDLPVIDLRALPPVARETEAARWSIAEARRPFDLVRGPLLRVILLRLANGEWSALFCLHHIVGDGWSIEVVIREIAALYAAFTRNLSSPLPELPIQYTDFAVWQRGRLAGPELAAQLDYWRERLDAAPAVSQLPLDRPRPPVQRFHGQSLRQELPGESLAALRRRAQEANASLFMGLLAAFYALLIRHSGANDLAVGTQVAGRTRPELEGLIGPFLNTLVLRLRLESDPSFSELLAQVRGLGLGAFAHQDLPFAKLVAELAPERDLSHTPLFQVQMLLVEADYAELRLPGLSLSAVPLEENTSKLDLTLWAHARPDGLELLWRFNTDLFDESTIRRLGAHFEALLAAAVAEPGRALADLPLLSAAEEHQLRAGWNDTAVAEWLAAGTLHGLVAAQATRAPQRPAVSYEGETLTYGELLAAARRLACRLRELGVGPDVAVGVFAERSLEMVVGLLAVLEAGGAYLPLDPSYPADRLAYMLADAAVPVLLAQEHLLAQLPAHGAVMVPLDGAAAKGGDPAESLDAAVAPDHLAYVIYTSGSTGRPKGTMNTHRGIVNRLLWMQERYGLRPEDRVLQKTPYSFDVSVWEFFWPLLVGARLVMARPGGHQDPGYLVRTIQEEGITTLHFVPSMLQVFLEAPGVEGCASLVRTICSGEALPAELERRFFARLPAAELHNLYGPTEAAVDVTFWACEREGRRSTVPIGYPVANTRIHIVDRWQRPVPIGVAGELLIGGVQLGRGYLARPELTAERFVPDGVSGEAGARLYCTGDLARALADGAVEFLGRIDYQVKLRGLRIELGEIESALAGHPAVREAVVVARADGGAVGAVNLVAYVTARQAEEAPTLDELRRHLGAKLPEYMLPSALVVLESLPLTASGKVDRKALPEPQRMAAAAAERVAPRTELERILARLWSEVLAGIEAESIGVDDNFFQLGGNSITGAILINRLQETLHEIVHVVTIFDAPTIAGLAALLVKEYPRAVARLLGEEPAGEFAGTTEGRRIDAASLAEVRSWIRVLGPLPEPIAAEPKNPSAVFVLSPPRSGSTLLRVMLGGHPGLFAPPELELLNFDALGERREAFPGRDAFRLEGLLRAVMEARGCTAEQAGEEVARLEREGASTRRMYRLLQSWIGERTLVDKTPTYAWDPEALRRAEAGFDSPRYIHLLRHPLGMVRSFEEARIDQIFFHGEHPFSRRELAELLWGVAYENTLAFLREIPRERQCTVRFEDLLRESEAELRRLCAFLGLEYHPVMAEPYRKTRQRMTDGLHAESRMLGDVKFHQHAGVDASVAERWREEYSEESLGGPTRELAARLGYAIAPPEPAWSPIPRGAWSAGEPLPLSFAQERLWFLSRLDPDSPAYNISAALRLVGKLDVAALAATLAEIVRRHAVLRTTFTDDGYEPVQVIHPQQAVGLAMIDLAGLPAAEREAKARDLVLEDLRQPFDLERGPLLRTTLVRLGDEEHLLLASMHHIVSDGWSLAVLVREVGALYGAFARGERASLPELPIQYVDYAVWQRDRLQGDALSAQVAYWRQRLAGAPALLRLPIDRPRPAVQRFRGARVDAWLPPELHAVLRAAGQRQGATLFMVLLAAFAVLLRRHTGMDDLVVGTPAANRDRAELEGLIGFFVNTLVLRADLSADPSFAELLPRVRETALGAYAHQDLPFEKLVAELQPERSLSYSPLFQVMLALQNASAVTLELPGLLLRDEPSPQEVSKFDLTLTVNETPAGLLCQWRYNSELFDHPTVERLADRLRNLVEGITAAPGRRISELPLVAEAERRQLLADWSRGEVVKAGSRSLHAMVEAQAKQRPDAPAVIFEGGELSYAELNGRCNRLARRLRRLGVGPEVPVGVCVERSPEMVVGLIAVLKAGGAYVPLDPAYPRERLAWLLEDSGITVLLTQEHLRGDLPPHAAQVVIVDEEPAESARNLRAGSGSENLAYVIYTSGSTGRPKGVLVSHRGLDNLAQAQTRLFAVGPQSRVLQFASLSFDASVSEIAMAFHAGAALCLAPRRDLLPGPELIELLQRQRITTVTLPPSALAALPEVELPDLRTIVVAGEACFVELARRWSAGRRLVNAYGPTEATVCATAALYDGGDRLPVGRPIQNTEAYVLDEVGQPVPSGVPGELLVGGIGLARGYRGRPELTAERFVPHPFSSTSGERLYRTGDLARFLPGGNLEFLGRIDHQIKVRGVRVEPGEVEAALLAQPGVREAVAVAREDGSGPARLVAYVAPAADAVLDPASLRSALAGSLPEPLVPAAVVVLDVLPLTPSGKVDRQALPAPDGARISAREYVAPATELERFLAGLWQEILGVERVGSHDDFFALGGNSISGAMFVNRLQRELGEIVHVVVMFDAPTVAQLAAWVADNYPEAVVRLFGPEALGSARRQAWTARVDAARVAAFRALIPPPAPLSGAVEKNPPAAFVLSPPRSGSTLLRVMLAGNPRLFAPPELELLSFDTLAERRAAFPGRNSFWLEGVTRAVMEVRGCGAEEAEALLAEMERESGTTRALYRRLQGWIGERTLVDKTPSYALDPGVLQRAEAVFAGARYIHLLRHPYGMIRSFEEAKLEQVFFRHPHSLSRRELAELIWLVSQQNILEFLAEVPPERQMQVRFEELLAAPEAVLRGVAEFLGVEYHPDMAAPYREKSARMTDGIYAWSRMLGDVKFHQHAGIDRTVAERWRELAAEDFLGGVTWEMAERLGYPRERPQAWAAIAPAAVESGQAWPLSFAQERLWVLDRMDPGSPAYNILTAVRLIGRLDAEALARSLTEIVRRHAALRSFFTEREGRPAQVVAAAQPVALPRVDLASLPAEERESEAERLALELGSRPYDLERGPMLRALLLRLGAEEHTALFGMHHIASDGWSMGVLIREISVLYAAFREGRPSPLPELPIQYFDYARWQRDWLQGEILERELAYWREALAGVEPLQLPADRPRPPVQTFRGARFPVVVPGHLTAAVAALGQRQRATLFMTLLAAYVALLHRYSGQDDLTVGTPHANRDRAEMEPLIGFFVNTLTLRADAAGDPGFRTLLERMRQRIVAAFAHLEVPFEKVVEELRPERDLARSPLFQVMFILQNAGSGPLELPGLSVTPLTFPLATAKFELTLTLFEAPDGLAGTFEFNTDLFEEATIARLAGHFGRLLESATADPDRSVGDLPLLSGAEISQLLADWNNTERAWDGDLLVHELFAAQAARTPAAVAVSQGSETLTYAELAARSNRLARHLRRLGVGPEVRVGLCLERTPEMVVALLAILQAGGAYVPLDPSHPAERLGLVIEDSDLLVLVTEETLLGALPDHGAAVLCLDRESAAIAVHSGAPLERWATAENLAYVIYTSGSTGRPKGVQLPHRAVVNFLLAMAERPGLQAGDVIPALTTISFDIAGLEIYLPLAVGGRIEMVKREEAADGALLAARLAACGATLLQATPATWRLLLDAGWQGDRALKALCGGEALPRELAASLLEKVGELWNVYGPTETAVWSAAGEVGAGEGPVLLGAPIANTRFYVVERRLRPVPVGVPGELWIAGDGVARGYLGRPDLTAERFAPDPFAEQPGARLYRTGDLVRYRTGGALEFLGRLDHQVKVRGYRIELGEIESALLRHASVREAVVVVREEGGEKRLVAYLVTGGGVPLAGELREHLKSLLPDYMVPAVFVPLESLPLTPSGKVDRRALPPPGGLVSGEERYVAPEGPVEELVAGIWSAVLHAERIGAEDNFFDRGGHSLLATQVMSRLRAALGVELPLQRLFEAPTVRGLTRAVEQARREGAPPPPPISRQPREGDLPLSFAQERLWFLHRLDPQLTAYNLVQSVRLRGIVDPRTLERAVGTLARRHEVLRTAFAMGGGGPRQIVHPRVTVPFVQVDLRRLAAERREGEIERCAQRLAAQPFDLAALPLFRMVLIELAEDESVLVILLHHIVADGWSVRRVISELAALYAADREGLPSPLPELPIQYGDFAVWQRRWLAGERLAAQLEFWRGHLAGAPPLLLELPTDRPRPALQSSRGASHRFELAAAAAQGIKELSRRRGLTPFMTLLATFETLLWRYTRAADLVVGIPIANRNRAELENLIGTFVNMLALRTRIPGGALSFSALAEQVRDAALGAFAHQDLPFEKLVDELRPERSLSHSPLFQVMFNLLNQPMDRLELPGLIFETIRTARSQAQVDLTLTIAETPDGERFEASLEYNSDLFDAGTVERMAVHFRNLAAGIVADAERTLSALPLLAAEERSQLLTGWNETAMERPRGRLIHELFTARAAAAPAAPAVSFGSAVMCYGELDARSNRLASHLRSLGVGPEVRVGLCLERTPEMVVALLGVLKAGGAYVPLEPSHPAERLAMVIGDAELAVLVTEERWLAALPPHAARVVCLDRDRPAIDAESAAAPPRAADDENLAYVIYTSGSTGRPKGVQLPHRAVVNFLLAMLRRPGLTAADVVPAVTTLTFDIAGLEIYLPLAVGGRVEVIGREEVADGTLFAARLKASGATALQATPAAWRLLLDAGWEGLAGLKALCGGEALPRELAAALLPRVAELWNVYGPTETAVWSSAGRVAPGDGPVLLGGPIGNTRFLVVDRDLEPVPVGVAGELWIAGDGVARGYLGRPDLTAERFAPDPFAAQPGARLYRTGDLVRWRPSGELEFLGRLDHQVKVRGFRIELGEIEAALLRHPSVGAAVVVVREDAGDKRLVAYLVAGGESGPAAGELRQHLKNLLPDYMVPAAFVVLDAFPLTPSGKVDRRALPAPEAGAAPASAFAAPRGPLEELVAAIWAEVLRVERVGANDDFFALGGHSLLATQVVSRLRTALGIEVPLQKLFATPTVAALARLVEEARAGGAGLSLPPAVRMPRQGSYPLSFAQQRMWFLHQLAPGSAAFNLAQALRLRGNLDIAALDRCFAELVRRHEALRTVFREEQGGPAQVVQPPAPLPLPVVDLAALAAPYRDAEARRLATDHQALPFDLARDWPLRTALLRLDDADHALLLTMHHIASDGWSFGVLVRELVALYRAFVAGEPSSLPELAVQYPDFAVWQRRVLAGETLEAEIAWWRGRLAGDPPPLRLPADRRRAGVQGFKLEAQAIDLPAALTAELHALSRRQAASLYMTLLAAWKGLLARLTAEEDILVGAPIANRNRTEVEGLIGFFLNTLLLRTDLAGNPRFGELLGRVRETALDAFAHQDLPLEIVLQAVHPERDVDRASPFEIMFLLQNVPASELAVPGLTFSVLDAEQRLGDLGTAAFEVGLTLAERRDGGGLSASITYNALLFDPATVVRLLERYGRLLAAVANPEQRLWDFDLLSETERSEVLVWGGAPEETAAVPFVPVHRAFEERAAAAPDAVAVIAGERRLTYGELDRWSNRLAHRLRLLGVGPEQVVGVAVERSPELIVALLAVLKAGGAYAPLDPSYPPERLAFILDDAAATVLLTTAAVLAAVPALGEGQALPLLLDGDGPAGESEAPLDIVVDEDNLVYLIYTSGSTGRPKGVMVRHGALAGYVAGFREEHALSPQDGVLQFASIGFDTSAEEIYPCLTSGATLVLRDEEMLASTPDFLRACGELGVTVLDLPTAFWHEMTARLLEESAELPSSLRLTILGGERVQPERLAAWQGLGYEQLRLVNTYGPTETTIVATRCELTAGRDVPGEVPIGQPVPGARAYVADPYLDLSAKGIPGELCIAGAGLARGYLGRPDLTAERFLPDPWSAEPGARLYRTGDLVRWLPSGDLEFLGRIDDQVKIRGYRVELREIEAALGLYPAVAEAVVVPREDTPGDRRLVAYVVPCNGEAPASELRAFLRERLPDYMVPASVVTLRSLPITPSGKVDRRALPAPDRFRAEADSAFIPPRTAAEETVASIWQTVLGLDRVGATDNFFELGGHSLLLPQVMHRLRSSFQVEIPLRTLFDEATVEGLAIAIEELLLADIERQLGALEGADSVAG
ncbi:MAG TPA: non-ribosomal peptide synthase/polyketide synthase [Thermoanaerobaculia bacterium]|nr:non-ribosomal peptide synthase/polyketide synthase [Thermoanaerobaculia bacterium]